MTPRNSYPQTRVQKIKLLKDLQKGRITIDDLRDHSYEVMLFFPNGAAGFIDSADKEYTQDEYEQLFINAGSRDYFVTLNMK